MVWLTDSHWVLVELTQVVPEGRPSNPFITVPSSAEEATPATVPRPHLSPFPQPLTQRVAEGPVVPSSRWRPAPVLLGATTLQLKPRPHSLLGRSRLCSAPGADHVGGRKLASVLG